jgi:hypothetical protein
MDACNYIVKYNILTIYAMTHCKYIVHYNNVYYYMRCLVAYYC